MRDENKTWHYGLHARYWAEFHRSGPEILYYQQLIERYGQPALDVGCGTGRLLLPWLSAGLDVDGCDVSADMLAQCAAKAERSGFTPQLYAQAMHELELPRRYQSIVACGSFSLVGARWQALEALRRFHHHLRPGGHLLLDHHSPYANPRSWLWWMSEHANELPQPWPTPTRDRAANGDEFEVSSRVLTLDPVQQVMTMQMRIALWRNGQCVASEEHELRDNLYFPAELRMMLEQSGFDLVAEQGGFSSAPATREHEVITLIAKRRG